MRQQVALAAAVLAAVVLPTLAFGSAMLTGKYATTIKSPSQLKGTWILSLTKGGTYTVVDNGQLLVRGRYATTGARITFGHETGSGACAKAGTYTWKKSGKTLRFTRVSESPACSGRSAILAHTFTQR